MVHGGDLIYGTNDFAKAIIEKKPIKIFNYGNMKRDFTYIDDIVEGIYKCTEKIATKDLDFNFDRPNISSSFAPYRIFNIGNNTSVNLLCFVEILESCLGIKAIKDFQPMQSGDIETTFADISLIKKWVGFKPKVSIEIGIERFAKWFLDYYGIKK